MDFKNNEKNPKNMQKQSNRYDIDMSNITVMGTPRPRACSTVERKE